MCELPFSELMERNREGGQLVPCTPDSGSEGCPGGSREWGGRDGERERERERGGD